MSYVNQNILDGSYKDSYQNIKNFILYSLGYPLVRVELVEEHLILAIVEAITLFYDVAAQPKDLRIVPVDPDNTLDIPDDIYQDMIEDIVFPSTGIDSVIKGLGSGSIGEGDGAVFSVSAQTDFINSFDLTSYYMYLQKLEDFKKVMGFNKHWEILNNKIVLYPANVKFDRVGILYKDLNDERQFEQEPWIKEYALARAKHILGTIRSKMSGFQSANQNVAQDGEALKSEAKEEMAKLKEDLNFQQAPLPIMQI